MKSALAAFKFLTFGGGFDLAQVTPQQTAAATLYFPLVGLLFGFVLTFLNRLLDPYLESEILGAILIAVLTLLTGAIHYQGLQNTFNVLSLKTKIGEAKIHSAAFGVLAIVFVVLFKVRALEVTNASRFPGGANGTLDWFVPFSFCFVQPELSREAKWLHRFRQS